MTTERLSSINVFLMLILIVFWGSSFVVVKMALREGLTPVAVATFRFLLAGGSFFVVLALKKNRDQNSRFFVEMRDVHTLLLLALSGITFFFTAQYLGIQMAGASIAAIFVCLLSPIFITVLSPRMLKEHLNRKQLFGIGVAAAGTLIVIGSRGLILEGNREFFHGSLILLSTPFLWTVYSILGKKTMEKYDPLLVVANATMIGGLCLIPFSLAENSLQQLFTLNLNSIAAILFLSVTCSLIGYYIWFHVLKQTGAAVTSTFLFFEPLVTVVLAMTLIGEEVSTFVLLGGLLIFAGVYLVTRR